MTTATTTNTTRVAAVTVGSAAPVQWQTTTIANDDTPDAFTIAALTGQAVNTVVNSSAVTVTGTSVPKSVTVPPGILIVVLVEPST